MPRTHYQHSRGKLWNLFTKVKFIQKSGSANLLNLPRKWLEELNIKKEDPVVLVFDIYNEQIIIRKAPEGIEIEQPSKMRLEAERLMEVEVDEEISSPSTE